MSDKKCQQPNSPIRLLTRMAPGFSLSRILKAFACFRAGLHKIGLRFGLALVGTWHRTAESVTYVVLGDRP